MKWWETLGIIAIFGAVIQFMKWMLDSLGLNNSIGGILTFLISVILTTLIVIVLIQIQQYKEIKKIEAKLNMKEEDSLIMKIIKKDKKGQMIDPKIILWILVAIMVYLFLKSIGIDLLEIIGVSYTSQSP